MTAPRAARVAPSPPPPCPSCGGLMGDGDRVMHGRCGLCQTVPARRVRRRCWCGRTVEPDAAPDVFECFEHDLPIPEVAQAPSDPLTPGGVFNRLYP